MKFRITPHSAFKASKRPADANDLLWQRLDARHDQVSFAKVGSEIRATWGDDVPSSMESDERAEIGRRVVLDIVREACNGSQGLEFDWFAVSLLR